MGEVLGDVNLAEQLARAADLAPEVERSCTFPVSLSCCQQVLACLVGLSLAGWLLLASTPSPVLPIGFAQASYGSWLVVSLPPASLIPATESAQIVPLGPLYHDVQMEWR